MYFPVAPESAASEAGEGFNDNALRVKRSDFRPDISPIALVPSSFADSNRSYIFSL